MQHEKLYGILVRKSNFILLLPKILLALPAKN